MSSPEPAADPVHDSIVSAAGYLGRLTPYAVLAAGMALAGCSIAWLVARIGSEAYWRGTLSHKILPTDDAELVRLGNHSAWLLSATLPLIGTVLWFSWMLSQGKAGVAGVLGTPLVYFLLLILVAKYNAKLPFFSNEALRAASLVNRRATQKPRAAA